jgi:hypothetical protein
MQSSIRFVKDIYLTGFAIIFRASKADKVGVKAGVAAGILTLIQWFFLVGLICFIATVQNEKVTPIIFSTPVVLPASFVLFFVNVHFSYIRGYGIKFAEEFDRIKRTRKTLLVTSFAVFSIAAVAFGLCSRIAYNRLIGAN